MGGGVVESPTVWSVVIADGHGCGVHADACHFLFLVKTMLNSALVH